MGSGRLRLARRRQVIVFAVFTLFAVRLGYALFDIQVRDHAGYVEAARKQQKKRVVIPPQRGTIYDRNGIPLAVNRQRHQVYLIPRQVEDVGGFVDAFTDIVPYDPAELRRKLGVGGWYVRLLRGASRETVERLEEADLEGIGIETRLVRHYPHGTLAASVLGGVDVDNRGIEGIELYYDEALRGQPGWAIHQRDALGREYPNLSYAIEPPTHGTDLHLTLDLELQEIVEVALEASMERTRARSGSVVVVDPRTGEVLAMADRYADDHPVRPLRNAAVVDQFEPGSTLKIVTLSGLYEENVVAPTDSVFCEDGRWVTEGRTLTDVHPYGWLTVEQVIEESSNICAAKLARRLGDARVYEYARRFGFGLPSGLDFPGEPRGLLKRPEEWSPLTSASIAMGYEVMVTSLQMAMAYAAIANGGELLRPFLARKLVAPDGTTTYRGERQRIRRVVERSTADLVARALERVVEVGTARSAQLDMIPVAGKTGTARKTGTHGYERGRYTSSFAGFFPATEARYVAYVRIDEPVGEFYGGAVAAPVFREAMASTLLTETLEEAPGLVERVRGVDRVVWTASDTFGALAREERGGTELVSSTRGSGVEVPWSVSSPASAIAAPSEEPRPMPTEGAVPYVVDVTDPGPPATGGFDPRARIKVPDFSGIPIRRAVQTASRLGLRLTFDGTGVVVAQDPEPGEVVPRGAAIALENP